MNFYKDTGILARLKYLSKDSKFFRCIYKIVLISKIIAYTVPVILLFSLIIWGIITGA